MKTALGYAFLAFSAVMAFIFIIVSYFSISGQIHIIDPARHSTIYVIGAGILGLANLIAVFPLAYFGFKWIRREAHYGTPPTSAARHEAHYGTPPVSSARR